ncbi:hypothetical protein DDB_G0275825 [Dictyostelium discoideum AX4]|uniref:Uncharacterized protein DDB_G0275825 n=1 Tax=Dictyostelium discoideum TaxID=44689 RepID=Y5395_DICDI|nr:hypothetical protein DDB_G0275825 [Dictyostelium discoideum AX4]Q553J1.1 RecName: Full=Uncharacterized protein DDB_G0275825 [Dictyostelium discoideum]EAL69663.1 hypothetical protein DDB_G0275825 [Dictyostelium discoideum AX4]|eukprot:XP_643422.1 hypothetical protein DDB_G0275825 [Dictyostelium discoideum AX4]
MLFKSLNQLFNSSLSSMNSSSVVNSSSTLNVSFDLNSIQGTNKYYNSIFTRPQMYQCLKHIYINI